MLSKEDRRKIKHALKETSVLISQGWENFSRNRRLPDALVIDIDNVSGLQQVMRAVYKLNKHKAPKSKITLRPAAGNGFDYSESFSFSPCIEADVIIRLTGECFKEVMVDANDDAVRVGANVQVGKLDQFLYNNHGLVLPTSSLFGYPSTVGLAANAGHGSGKDQPGFAGLIKELYVCRPDGQLEVIDARNKDFEVIRAAHMGLFGVVINQVLQCIPAKKIHARMNATNIESLTRQIDRGLYESNDYVSVMYVPTYRKQEETQTKDDNVLILKMNPVSLRKRNKNHHPFFSKISQDLSIQLQEAFQVPDILVKYPKFIPHYMRYIVSDISIGSDKEAVGPWPDMMHYQTAFPWKIDDADYLFQVSKDHHEIKNALHRVVGILGDFAHRGLYPVTYAIYFRLFQGTNGGLSTSSHDPDKKVCGFDIVSHPDAPGYAEFKKCVQDYFIKELNARPHWGKTVPLDVDYARLYGKDFDQFKGALNRWYKEGEVSSKMSSLITPYFAKILNFKKHEPVLHSRAAQVEANETSRHLDDLLNEFPEDGRYGSKINRNLAGALFSEKKARAGEQEPVRARKRTVSY